MTVCVLMSSCIMPMLRIYILVLLYATKHIQRPRLLFNHRAHSSQASPTRAHSEEAAWYRPDLTLGCRRAFIIPDTKGGIARGLRRAVEALELSELFLCKATSITATAKYTDQNSPFPERG